MSEPNFSTNSKPNHLLLGIVIGIFVIVTIIGSIFIGATRAINPAAVYNMVAFIVIMIWMCILTAYFIWALGFYNINFGLANSEWDKIYHAKEQRRKGEPYNEKDLADEPIENPYKTDTFGLPTGTVRGMIAFTLLFGAIALLVASLSPQNQLKPNSFLVDQFEFFKTAFLMMIAFYFGARSLEILKGKPSTADAANPDVPIVPETVAYKDTSDSDAKPEEAPQVKVNVAGNITTIPVITQVKDPMAFNEK
jgi:hypothetical protein